jgi:proteic killer suppression protein
MIQTFRTAATEDLFRGRDSKVARKAFPKELWSMMRRKLDMLHAAPTLNALATLPGTRLENLKHTMPGYYSIRVNDRFRVTFKFENGAAFDVAIEDYH